MKFPAKCKLGSIFLKSLISIQLIVEIFIGKKFINYGIISSNSNFGYPLRP